MWPAAVLVALGVLVAISAWSDVRTRLLPNWLALLTAGIGLALAAYLAPDLAAFGWHVAHAAIAFLIGIVLFSLGLWGGGDGKFYAAIAGWFALSEFFLLIFAISAVGLVLVLAGAVRRKGKLFRKNGTSVPYGVAIGLGGWLAMAWSLS